MSIYRYKLSTQITNELNTFVTINKYCIPQDFKENWDEWIKTKTELINIETTRLKKLGYTDSVVDKMYRSARYYLKNKSNIKENPSKRKKYIRLSREIKDNMDFHIDRIIETMKPSDGLELFTNLGMVKKLIKKEMEEKNINKDDMKNMIKKMYKNRYYIKQKKNSD